MRKEQWLLLQWSILIGFPMAVICVVLQVSFTPLHLAVFMAIQIVAARTARDLDLALEARRQSVTSEATT